MKAKKKAPRCPQCNRPHDVKLLEGVDGTFVCVHCGVEFDVKEERN